MQKTVIYIFLYAAFNVSGATLIKMQLKHCRLAGWQEWINFMLNVPFLIASSFIVFSALALFKALANGAFSFVVPIATGMNFLLTVIVGYFLFQDRLSVMSYFGFILIMAGVLILSTENQAHA
jgi:multidrug transporter EmrE-like cation transporter